MSPTDRGEGLRPFDDLQRKLLESAREDGPSAEQTHEAWKKFAAGVGAVTVASGAATAGGKLAFASAARAGAFWLLTGALAGVAATSAWVASQARVPRSAVVFVREASSAPEVVASVPPIAPSATGDAFSIPSASPSPPILVVPPQPSPVVSPSVSPSAPTASVTIAPSEVPAAPSLAAEVSALDPAVSALAAARFDDALQSVDDYRARYPDGVLARDADVVVIEALFGKGDREGALRASALFLKAYPDDPHARRVRSLSE